MTAISINLSPDDDVLDGRHLAVVVERWLADCARRLPAASVTTYRNAIRSFLNWWATVGPSQGWQLREVDLLAFSRWLTGLALAYSTRKKILSVLRSMFHWAARRRYTQPLNCAYWVPVPEGSGRLHLPLSVTELAAMMRCAGEADEPFLRVRNLALLSVFIGTGARRSEVAGLAVEDVSLRSDYSGDLLIREAKEVQGRDVCQRLAYFDRHAGRYLARWLAVRGRVARGPLWLADCGEPLTGQGIYKAIRGIARSAGVRFGGLHDFRRTFITHFADKRPGEGHYHLLQLQIGHKPQGITHQRYDLRTIDSIRPIFCSPMEEIVRLLGGASCVEGRD